MILLLVALALLGLAPPASAQSQSGLNPTRAQLDAALPSLPTADAVVARFSDDAERVAALQILLDLYEFRMRSAPPEAAAKVRSYRQTIDKIRPPAAFDERLYTKTRELRASPEFRLRVIATFLPSLAGNAANAVAKAQAARAEHQSLFNFWASLAGTCVLAVLFPVVYAVRFQRARPAHGSPTPAFQLPRPLADARTWFRTYGLTFECGTVVRMGDIGHIIRTPDGRQIDIALGGASLANPGDVVSIVHHGRGAMLVVNHTTGGGDYSRPDLEQRSALPISWLFRTCFLLVIVAFTAITHWVLPAAQEVNGVLGSAIGAWALGMFLVLYFEIGFLNRTALALRMTKFESTWLPSLRAFIQERGPAIVKANASTSR